MRPRETLHEAIDLGDICAKSRDYHERLALSTNFIVDVYAVDSQAGQDSRYLMGVVKWVSESPLHPKSLSPDCHAPIPAGHVPYHEMPPNPSISAGHCNRHDQDGEWQLWVRARSYRMVY